MKVFVVVGVVASLLVAGAAEAKSRHAGHRRAPGGSSAARASRMPALPSLDGGGKKGGAASLDGSTLSTGGGKGGGKGGGFGAGLGGSGLAAGGGKHGRGGGDVPSGLGGGKHGRGGGDVPSGLGGGKHGGRHQKGGSL